MGAGVKEICGQGNLRNKNKCLLCMFSMPFVISRARHVVLEQSSRVLCVSAHTAFLTRLWDFVGASWRGV